jgi:hypothetical protein
MHRAACACLVLICGLHCTPLLAASGPGGTLKVEVIDRQTKQPVACRMHLTNAAGKALKAPRVPYWHDHFVFDGNIAIKLPKGEYDFVIERGLEYLTRSGHFTMDNFSNDKKVFDIERFADMAAEGWWSGDLDVARPAKDLKLLMRADDLHVVQLITWPGREVLLGKSTKLEDALYQFDGNRFIHALAGIDSGSGGTLLYFNLDQPLDLGGAEGDVAPRQETISKVRGHQGAWVDAQMPYGWDMPVFAANGEIDSVQVLNSNIRRASAAESERGGKPRDRATFSSASGNGRWSEAIYYHLLNCGLRIPPTAGSGSGEVANPLGQNRMYVHVEGDLTYDKWWEGVRAGRVTITNGPLMRPTVEGELPGYVFRAEASEQIELEVGLNFATRDKVAFIEMIKDGRSEYQIRMEEFAKTGTLPAVVFKESGWFVLRAVADVPETYRYAITAPYYVEIGKKPRISKKSAEFFLAWVEERRKALKVEDASKQEALLKRHEQAKAFWQDMATRANAP